MRCFASRTTRTGLPNEALRPSSMVQKAGAWLSAAGWSRHRPGPIKAILQLNIPGPNHAAITSTKPVNFQILSSSVIHSQLGLFALQQTMKDTVTGDYPRGPPKIEVREKKVGATNGFYPKNGGKTRADWKVNASVVAKNTFNPIRDVMETMVFTPNPDKKMISLSLGDPTVYKNLNPAPEVVEAVRDSLVSVCVILKNG